MLGGLVDSTCILWQTTCDVRGSCLHFDTAQFRYRTYGAAGAFEVGNLAVTAVLLYLVRKPYSKKTNAVVDADQSNGKESHQPPSTRDGNLTPCNPVKQ